jgi:hypothetical protein
MLWAFILSSALSYTFFTSWNPWFCHNYISFTDQNSVSHNLPHENTFCQQQVSVNILLLEF